VTPLKLTSRGRKFFDFASSDATIKLHEFHRREVSTLAPGFLALAQDNQICLSEKNTILTFQGHPEMSTDLARALLSASSDYTNLMEEAQLDVAMKSIEEKQDGVEVWRKILEWVQD
jgi:GMP synthase-like glutamine amidotransferase